MGRYHFGIDVGGTKIAYGLYNEQKELVDKHRTASNKEIGPEEFFDGIDRDIRMILDRNSLTLSDVNGVGIGMPSFILFDEGKILMTTSLTNIKNFYARDYLSKKLGVRVVIDNDSHAGAIAEHRFGAGRGFRHMIYCPVSTGISAGLIINDHIFRGSYGFSGEAGHMLITPDEGILCGCENKGCFLSHTSGLMIVKHIQEKIRNGEKTVMTELAGSPEKISAEHIKEAVQMGDEMAKWALDHMAKYLAVWIFNMYMFTNINCFVFGGGLCKFGDLLFGPIRTYFDSYNHNEMPVYFKFAELGDDFGIIGAAELLFEEA